MLASLKYLEKLIGFETVSDRSNLEMLSYIKSVLAPFGFRFTEFPNASGEKAGLLAEIGPESKGIALSGHMDVVPVVGQAWQRPPFRMTLESDRVYGRGTTDMKGFLAAMLFAGELAGSARLRAPLKLIFSYDEEVGCLGMTEMIDHLTPHLKDVKLCILGEPTSMQFGVGHKGKAAFRSYCLGQAGHSALAPNYVNALHPAVDIINSLRALQAEYANNGAHDEDYAVPFTTFHVGKFSGGIALNIVPERADIEFEYRNLPADCQGEVEARIEVELNRISQNYGQDIITQKCANYPEFAVKKDATELALAFGLVNNASLLKVNYGTEAGIYARENVPTIICGPGSMDGQGHKADEYLELKELAACEAMMQMVVRTLT